MITFDGITSVLDRTVFTENGPIVKPQLPLRNGNDLIIINDKTIYSPSANFQVSDSNLILEINGSPNNRNDGRFVISKVINSSRVELSDSFFDITDESFTISELVIKINELKNKFNLHIISSSHKSEDVVNTVTSQDAVDLPTSLILLNEIKDNFSSHIIDISDLGQGPVHKVPDDLNTLYSIDSINLISLILLYNEVAQSFNQHIENKDFHVSSDFANRIQFQFFEVSTNSGPLIGPFNWTIIDPRYGQIADNTSDVFVRVNGVPASIDAVFGILGAIVLTTKPSIGDEVSVDYEYISNPPIKFLRLNSFEFVLNQYGNKNYSGYPGHLHRSKSYLIQPKSTKPDISSPYDPNKINYRYKALELAYTASLNNPNTFLLNNPSNKVKFDTNQESINEYTVKYDANILPQNANDKWEFFGVGSVQIINNELKISDSSSLTGQPSPVFSKDVDLRYDRSINAAVRLRIDPDTVTPDGCFTGVSFVLSKGSTCAILGFILTTANNLISAIKILNTVKNNFNSHNIQTGVHLPNDTNSSVIINDAVDLETGINLYKILVEKYNEHLLKGPEDVHKTIDVLNTVPPFEVTDEAQFIEVVNDFITRYNSHISFTAHYNIDTFNPIELIRQVGILKNGSIEDQNNWSSYPYDWEIKTTYRLSQDSASNAYLFLSGSSDPVAEVKNSDLPNSTVVDARISSLQQILFGSIGKQSLSVSYWDFIRFNVVPINYDLIDYNKSVIYSPIQIPELDPVYPWIRIGYSGTDRISSGNLISDSSAGSNVPVSNFFGTINGPYLGHFRYEPSLTSNSVISIEFSYKPIYWTFGVDNKSCGLFLEDGNLSTNLLFIQASPTPANVIGNIPGPFNVIPGDNIVFSVSETPVNIVFNSLLTTITDIVNYINSYVGYTLASNSFGYLTLSSPILGSSSFINIISGTSLRKFGINTGSYFGRDSNPEPKVSWFGNDLPNLDNLNWVLNGNSKADLIDRVLRISDTEINTYRTYSLNNPLYIGGILNSNSNWKMDAKFQVKSFIPSTIVLSGPDLAFAGALVSIDEGSLGRSLEMHLSIGFGNTPYVSIYSYNTSNGNLDYISSFLFNWNDSEVHTYNLFTSKGSNLVSLFVDSVFIGSFNYSSLNQGFGDPTFAFGSGSEPVSNANMNLSSSIVDWHSISVFKDSKIEDPNSSLNRYVGFYKGGDPEKLSSYYLHQIDWSNDHVYRVVRNPNNNVSLHVDGSNKPSISVSYSIQKFSPSNISPIVEILKSNNFVAFGSFSEFEISRSSLGYISYSLGRLFNNNGLVPPKQVLNQSNVITSSEHLKTKIIHEHFGKQVWSEGTPNNDVLSLPDLKGDTELYYGTPIVPLTQDLGTRGGLIKVVNPIFDFSSANLINQNGFLSYYENDDLLSDGFVSFPIYSSSMGVLFNSLISFKNNYNNHILSSAHVTPDLINTITSPDPVNEAQSITLINEAVLDYNSHKTNASVHFNADLENIINTVPVTNIFECVDRTNQLIKVYQTETSNGVIGHIKSASYHQSPDGFNYSKIPYTETATEAFFVLNQIKSVFNLHVISTPQHNSDDVLNVVVTPDCFDLISSATLASSLATSLNSHLVFPGHNNSDLDNTVSVPPPWSNVQELVDWVNILIDRYNNHLTLTSIHFFNDMLNYSVGIKIANSLDKNIVLLNSIKSSYNLHVLSSVYHTVNPADECVVVDAFDLPSSIILANDLKSKSNTHFSGPSRHQILNSENLISDPDSTDLLSLSILCQSLKKSFISHRLYFGVHGFSDSINTPISPASDLSSVISLLNDLKAKSSNHRIGVSFHKEQDTINVITTPDCTDLTSAITLFTDIRNKLNLHFVSNFHVIPDSNNFASGAPLNLSELITESNNMRIDFINHLSNLQNIGPLFYGSHGNSDVINEINVSTILKQCVEILSDLKLKLNSHLVSQSHLSNDLSSQMITEASYKLSSEQYNLPSVFNYYLTLKQKISNHFNNSISHYLNDSTNPIPSDPTDIVELFDKCYELKNSFNDHLKASSYHLSVDNFEASSATIDNTLVSIIDNLNQIRLNFNLHIKKEKSHIEIDDSYEIILDSITSYDVALLPQILALAISIKNNYNSHALNSVVHLNPDTLNVITSADPTDFQSLSVIINEMITKIGNHGTQTGVHGSSVIIRFETPDRVLYDNIIVYQYDNGGLNEGLSSISDDDEPVGF